MSTNKSTEDTEGLVPAPSSRSAAAAWWDTVPWKRKNELSTAPNSLNIFGIMALWIQEVVLPWWNKLSFFTQGYKSSEYNYLLTPSNEQIADIYLKEHTVKEESGTKTTHP